MARWFPLLILTLLCAPAGASSSSVFMDLEVALAPERHHIQATGRLHLPHPVRELVFGLRRGLTPTLETPQGELRRLENRGRHTLWALAVHAPTDDITLRWSGKIDRPPTGPHTRDGGSDGTIHPEGIYLSGATGWYPELGMLVRFRLRLSLPSGWHGLSQGHSDDDDRTWHENHPQEAIYLVAAPFHRYRRAAGTVEAMVWLRRPDPDLARRYLEATGEYIALYSALIGPYPYAKFALVENFWESGYGMPSFTLLGPRVIRLPFILHTSYPHEILHNWWGNSVYVDDSGGNWAEGLTTYLADHLLAAQAGRGAAYRRELLSDFASWVKKNRDLPLVRFRGRHGKASQAAGYGRMAMVMHMLRLRLGDRTFLEGLRRFYRDNRFQTAGFDALQRAFEAVSGQALDDFFHQWTRRTGAPDLVLEAVRLTPLPDGRFRIEGRLRQRQDEPPFTLRIPLYVWTEAHAPPRSIHLKMDRRHLDFSLVVPGRPLQLAVDPLFDLFRRLHPDEMPPSFSALFGAERSVLVLPDGADPALRAAYAELARNWQQRHPEIQVVNDGALDHLPEQGTVWILGWNNRFAPVVQKALKRLGVIVERRRAILSDGAETPSEGGFAVALRQGGLQLGWVAAASPDTVPALTRKLPHYGRYGLVAFDAAGVNRLRRQWPARGGLVHRWTDLEPPAPPDHPPLSALLEGQATAAAR